MRRLQGSQLWLAAMLPRSSIETPEALRAIRESDPAGPGKCGLPCERGRDPLHVLRLGASRGISRSGLVSGRQASGLRETAGSLALFHLDRNEEARTAMREVLRLDPENATTQSGRGWLLLLSNRQREARKYFLRGAAHRFGLSLGTRRPDGMFEIRIHALPLALQPHHQWSRLKPLAGYLILTCTPLAITGLLKCSCCRWPRLVKLYARVFHDSHSEWNGQPSSLPDAAGHIQSADWPSSNGWLDQGTGRNETDRRK